MVQASSGLSDGSGVAWHAHGSLSFGQVSTRCHSGRLVANVNSEASGAPLHKLDGLGGDSGRTDTFGNQIAWYNRQRAMHLPW